MNGRQNYDKEKHFRVEDFDVAQDAVLSSNDLGLGDINDFNLLFGPYFAAHPESFLAWAWHTGGSNPSLSGVTSTTDTLPRTLFPFGTGDTVPIDAVITSGTSNIGDGIIGWSLSGRVTPTPGTGLLAAIGFVAVGRRRR